MGGRAILGSWPFQHQPELDRDREQPRIRLVLEAIEQRTAVGIAKPLDARGLLGDGSPEQVRLGASISPELLLEDPQCEIQDLRLD